MRGHQPMEVIAQMAEPVVYFADGLHLDGLLAWACFQEHPGAIEPIEIAGPMDFLLPLSRWECGDTWGWCASAAHAYWQHEGVHELRKRTALDEMLRWTEERRVQVNGGPFKARNKTYPTMLAEQIHWYALGDLAEVRRLLNAHLTHIGKLCNHGLGRVRRWDVRECEADRSIESDGMLRRRMPVEWDKDGAWPHRYASIRAPYQHRSRFVQACEPLFKELRPVGSDWLAAAGRLR